MAVSKEISEMVARVLVQALNVDEDEIAPAATLQGDLGAESIDMLDIVFRLEREFDIKIPHGELFPTALFQGDLDFVQGDKVTDQGMEELRWRMPYADLSGLERHRRLSVIPDLFTVDLLGRYIVWKIGQEARARPGGTEVVPVTR